jgi:XTP/dITP diphosphohydrolase
MKSKKPILIIASTNKHKVKEIGLRLKKYKIMSLADFPGIPEIPETGSTFAENARIKARTLYRILKQPVLADDSGLNVDCLKGEPGVYSARYAGPHSTQQMLIKKLLDKMNNIKKRSAHFTTAMAYIDRKGRIHRTTGKVFGRILEMPRGKNGFGYDPLFYYPPFKRTFAELTTLEKNKVSHRVRALEKMIIKIRNIDKTVQKA